MSVGIIFNVFTKNHRVHNYYLNDQLLWSMKLTLDQILVGSCVQWSLFVRINCMSRFSSFHTQSTYSLTRSAGTVMFNSNVRAKYMLKGGKVVTEKLFGMKLVPDSMTVRNQSVAVGFYFGTPPAPSVSMCCIKWVLLCGVGVIDYTNCIYR